MNDSRKPQAMPTGPERELQLYGRGLGGGKPSVPGPLDLLEAKAKEILPPRAYDYVAGGAGGEDTMRANREAFYRRRIVPRMLRDVAKRDLSVELLGTRLPAPILLGPVGVQQIVHDDSDVASARAAASLGLPFVLSTMSSRPIEWVAQAADKVAESPRWFQLYWGKNPELTASMLQRAERSGYSALVVTLDALPDVVHEVNGRLPVLFDSGIRRGADVFKALALGARAVLLGRLYMWGLAVAGEQGVRDVLLNLFADFDLTMALCGYSSCRELDSSALCRDNSGESSDLGQF